MSLKSSLLATSIALKSSKILSRLAIQPFVSTKAHKQGSGMGLYFARMIAKEKLKAQLSIKKKKNGLKIVLEIPKPS